MRRQELTGAAGVCDATAGSGTSGSGAGGAIAPVRRITVLETRTTDQQTHGIPDLVVASTEKGTYLIRRRRDVPPGQCPLPYHEIRRIDASIS